MRCIDIWPESERFGLNIEKNNDNIERDDGVRILWYLGSFCIYGWEMKDYETDHSNRKT